MTLEEWLNDQVSAQVEEQVAAQVAASCEKASKEAGIKGRQEAVFELLEEYGIIPEHVREAVLAQKDLEVLKRWLKLAAKAGFMEQFEKEM